MQTTIRGRLTCFCRVCYVMWYGQKDVMNYICDVWDWSCSCNRNHDLHVDEDDNRHEPLIYCMTCVSMKTPCNYFTLLLTVSHSSRSNSWRDNFMKTRWWRSWCHASDDGDHDTPQRWRSKAQDDIGHIMSLYDLHVMFVMFTSYLLRTTVA